MPIWFPYGPTDSEQRKVEILHLTGDSINGILYWWSTWAFVYVNLSATCRPSTKMSIFGIVVPLLILIIILPLILLQLFGAVQLSYLIVCTIVTISYSVALWRINKLIKDQTELRKHFGTSV